MILESTQGPETNSVATIYRDTLVIFTLPYMSHSARTIGTASLVPLRG